MTGEKTKEIRVPIVIRGIGVGRGIAIGPLKFDPLGAESDRRGIAEDLLLLDRAVKRAREELLAMCDRAVKSVGEEHGEIFRIHLSLLDEGELLDIIRSRIEKGDKLQTAVEAAREKFVGLAEKEEERPKKARAAHVREVLELLLSAAEDAESYPEGESSSQKDEKREGRAREKYILVSSDGDSGFLRGPESEDVIGILCVGGSENSGLAAYARAKGIPALVIAVSEAPDVKYEGSGAIIDPSRGRLTVNPDLAALDRFTESTREAEETERRLASLIGLPSVTRSGRYMSLLATVDGESELAAALSADAEGVGLFKTEHLFDETSPREIEERQLAEYKKIFDVFKEKPVTVRAYAGGRGSDMGLKGVRYCLSRRDMFKAQLRAWLRAAAMGEISMAVPMAVSAEELRRVKAVMIETAGELRSEGIAFGDGVRLGAMIDTPAAAVSGELLAAEADFFIADTDSLASFTLAADRGDAAVSEILRKNPEPVLRLVGYAAKTLHASGKGKLMGVSGDLAADTSLTERFLSLGVDFLSVSPPYVLELREKIRECP